jgi:hypothetical protein
VKNGTMKPLEVLFYKVVWSRKENNGGEEPNQTGVKYMCIWKCHNETPV